MPRISLLVASWLLVALVEPTSGQSAGSSGLPSVAAVGQACGAAPATLSMSPPLSGESCRFTIAPIAPAAVAALFWSFAPATPLPLPGGCLVHVDPATVSLVDVVAPGENGVDVLLPPDPSWLGVPLVAQAATLPSGVPPGFDVSNGVAFTVGQRQGPLADVPSPAGAHLAAVAAMPADSWLDLGVPAPDPVHGLATGREYTPRMAWSSTLQGAFLTGESGHGYVNPQTGRYVDDVWFYDFAAHRWICVKPGSQVATLSLSLDGDQFEVDAQGQLVPTAQLGHGYEFVAFDEASQRFLMQPAPNTYWLPHMPQRLNWLPSATFPSTQYRSPWLFDSIAGVWLREPTAGMPAPDFNVNARGMAVLGVPGERFFYFDTSVQNRSRVWRFDAVDLAWHDEPTLTPAPAISGHGVACYDRSHHRVWYYGVEAASQKARLWYFDLAQHRWHDSNAPGVPAQAGIYTTANRGLSYDEAADVVLLKVKAGGGAPPSFHPFDVATNAWQPPVTPPSTLGVQWNYRHVNVCYASGHDVHLLHVAGGNSGTGRIVVYRRGG